MNPLEEGLAFVADPLDLSGVRATEAADSAAATQAAYNQQAIDAQQAMYDQTRTDLLPFLQAATGVTQFGNDDLGWFNSAEDAYYAANPDVLKSGMGALQHYNAYGRAEGRDWYDPVNQGGGALDQYLSGLGGAPGAPTLSQFQFNVEDAMNSPELAFQREFGEQQMDRVAAKNKQLGSGNRLYDLVRFGQGLASQSLQDQYNRQFNTWGANQNTDLKNYSLLNDRYNTRMNRLAGLIDVGRGSGSAMGTLGAQTGSGIAGLLNNTGTGYAAASLAPYQAQQQGINTLATIGGYAIGGPAGGAAANTVTSPGFMNSNILSDQNIGFY